MALSESDIKIIIAAELKKKGFKDAEKATNKLDEGFKRLGGTIATVFSAQQVINFGKQAMKAFVDDEQAAARFAQTLKGVNLGFATPEIERYLETLEKQTGVLKDDLRPAYANLAQTTRSLSKSQDILNTAIDVSAGSGVDLQSVISDLSRSYLGNNASLGKYNLGLSKAELRTTSFEKVQELLNKQFSGQRAAYLQTYAGRLELINVSYDKMQETIGGALLDSFQMLIGEGGIGGATSAMEQFGISAADAIRGIGVLVNAVQTRVPFFDQLQYLSQLPGAMKLLERLMDLGKSQRPLFFPTAGIGKPGIDKRAAALEEAAIKRQKELEALRLKALREQEKANRLKRISIALMEKEKKFDLTRIQLQAALQGKLTAEEEKRIKELMLIEETKQAIAEANVDKAEELMDKLKKLQDETTALAGKLTEFPKANDPFKDWTTTLNGVAAQLSAISQKKVVIDFITNYTGSAANAAAAAIAAAVPTGSAAAIAAATSPAAVAVQTAKEAEVAVATAEAATAAAEAATATAEAITAQAAAAEVLAAAVLPEEIKAAEVFVKAADEAAAAAIVQTEAAAALEYVAATMAAETALAEATQAEQVAEILAAESSFVEASAALAEATSMFDLSVLGAYAADVPSVEITVNVAGNVTAEQDLAETIYDTFLGFQKAGKGLLYSSRAI